jgi:hypothetical protein
MTHLPPPERPAQNLTAGKNATQVGGNYQQTTNYNFIILIIGILALGGVALGIYFVGRNEGSIEGSPAQVESSPLPATPHSEGNP